MWSAVSRPQALLGHIKNKIALRLATIADEGATGSRFLQHSDAVDVDAVFLQPRNIHLAKCVVAHTAKQHGAETQLCHLIGKYCRRPAGIGPPKFTGTGKPLILFPWRETPPAARRWCKWLRSSPLLVCLMQSRVGAMSGIHCWYSCWSNPRRGSRHGTLPRRPEGSRRC